MAPDAGVFPPASELGQGQLKGLDSALEWRSAVDRVAAAQRIEIGGTAIDVQTARGMVRAAAGLRARLAPHETPSGLSMRSAFQRDGYIGATLGELGRRADSVVLLGDVLAEYQHLISHYAQSAASPEAPRKRYLVLGECSDLNRYPAGTTHIAATGTGIHHQLATARAALARGQADADPLAQWLSEGQYSAWLWRSDVLDSYTATQLVGLNSDLNRIHRSVLIPIAGDTTVRSVATWLTGFSGPIEFGSGLPEMCAEETSSTPAVRIWLQPFPHMPAPPAGDAFLIVIGAAETTTVRRADLYVRAAAPGLECAGVSYRGDGTICVPLGQQQPASHPTAQEVLAALSNEVRQRRSNP